MLSLLLIPLLTQALLIHEDNCMEASCMGHLQDYLKQLNLEFQGKKEVLGQKECNRYLTTITQSKPPSNMGSLYVRVYTVDSETIEVTDLTGNEVDNNFEIYIRLSETDINNPLKCPYIDTDSIFINRECTFLIAYTGQKQSDPMKFYMYKMVVRIPRVQGYDYYVDGFLIDQKVGNSEIVEHSRYNVKLYKGATCKEEITPETILLHEDNICIGVFGNDVMTLLSYLEVGSLLLTYTRDSRDRIINMLGVTTIKRSLDGTNKKGQVHAIFPTFHIGKSSVSIVIASTQRKIVLSNELVYEEHPLTVEIHIGLPEILPLPDTSPLPDPDMVIPPPEEPEEPKEDEKDSADSVVVSLITFLCLLVVIF